MNIEEMLRETLRARAEGFPEPDELDLIVGASSRRRFSSQVVLVGSFALASLSIAGLALLMRPVGSSPASDPSRPAVESVAGSTVAFGQPETRSAAGSISRILSDGEVLYASVWGATDRILRSTDGALTWEAILSADPGDAEGLYGVGGVVVQVIQDDHPARDTVEPGSVVAGPLAVYVFDPASGQQTEATMPRPVDPEMIGLPLDSAQGECALGGYQSWVGASGVAVGPDRIVVIGSHQLVGQLADGTVVCDGHIYRHLAWTSDDGGSSWQMHDTDPLTAIAWTGDRYVAWSTDDLESRSRSLLVSDDGVDWIQVGQTPILPEATFLTEGSIFSNGARVVATAPVFRWTLGIPDGVVDPGRLREILGVGTGEEVEDLLEILGVELPLDSRDEGVIARHLGREKPTGVVLATSDDGGATWATNYVAEPITGVVMVGDSYVALTTGWSDPEDPSLDWSSALLISTDGINWSRAIDFPEPAFGQKSISATTEAVYLVFDRKVLRIPIAE